jgi:hypothetical protein
VQGDDNITYTWDNEKNEFYSGSGKNREYGTNDTFVNDVKDSLLYLKGGSEDASQTINELSETNKIANIREGYFNEYLTSGSRRINIRFSRNTTLVNDGTESEMSAATGLYHELSHAYSHLIEGKLNSRQKDKSVGIENKNAEEVNAVRMTDLVAGQLGEPIRGLPYSRATPGFRGNSVRWFFNGQ